MVSSAKAVKDGFIATTISTSGKSLAFHSAITLKPYDILKIKLQGGMPAGSDLFVPSKLELIGEMPKSKYEELASALAARQFAPGPLVKDSRLQPAMAAMTGGMLDIARHIYKTLATGAPAVVRFHSDGDGASGAMALWKAAESLGIGANISWRMHKSVAYDIDSMYSDFAFLDGWSSAENPLVLMIDFGTSKESEAALASPDRKYALICVDHHTLYEGFPSDSFDTYLNPWEHGGDSDITAGTMAAALAEMLSGEDMSEFAEISMISDHSRHAARHAARSAVFRKKAFVIDVLTGFKMHPLPGGGAPTPKSLYGVLSDNGTMDHIFSTSSAHLEKLIEEGIGRAKSFNSNDGSVRIFVVDFSKLDPTLSSGVPSGKYSSFLHDRVETENGDSVTIVVNRASISFRCTKSISDRIGILQMIKDMEHSYDYVVGGGGHKEAASMRINPSGTEAAISAIIDFLKSK